MAARRQSGQIAPSLSLLPFLDIIFSLIGIFIVVFALQQTVESKAERLAAIDILAVCEHDATIVLYPAADAQPISFDRSRLAALFEHLGQARGVENLVFAFSRDCFNTKHLFERQFARFAALPRQAVDTPESVFRLSYRPLASHEQAVAELLADWRNRSTDE